MAGLARKKGEFLTPLFVQAIHSSRDGKQGRRWRFRCKNIGQFCSMAFTRSYFSRYGGSILKKEAYFVPFFLLGIDF